MAETGQVTAVSQNKGITIDIVRYDHTTAQLKTSLSMYEGFELIPGDKKSEATLKDGLRFCRTTRPAIEKKRLENNKILRSAIDEHINNNNTAASDLQELIEPIETPLKEQRDKEKKRLDDLYKVITDNADEYILHLQLEGMNLEALTLEELNSRFEELDEMDVDPAVFVELKDNDKVDYTLRARSTFNEAKQAINAKIKSMELEEQKKTQDARQYDLDWSEAILMDKEINLKVREDVVKTEELKSQIRTEIIEEVKIGVHTVKNFIAPNTAEVVMVDHTVSEKERCLSYIENLIYEDQPKVENEKLQKQLTRIMDGLHNVFKSIQEIE